MPPDTYQAKGLFGRASAYSALLERARSFKSGFRQNVAVIGRPFIGKTFLIQNFIPALAAEGIIPVYAEARRKEPFGLFAVRFAGSLLFHYLKSKKSELKADDVKDLPGQYKKILPKTAEAVDRIQDYILKNQIDEAWEGLLDLPQLAAVEAGCPFCVIIEEFDRLAEYGLSRPFSSFGKKIMSQRSVFYIVTSSSVEAAQQILSEKLQLLFGNFEILELEEFDFLTAKDFLADRLKPADAPDRHIRFLLSFTDGHPFYLDVITGRLRELLLSNKKQVVTDALLEVALCDSLYHPHSPLYQHFVSVLAECDAKSNGVDVLSVLMEICAAENGRRASGRLVRPSGKKVAAALRSLQEHSILEKNGALNRVYDATLRFWLNAVYRRRRFDFTPDALAAQETVRLHIRSRMSEFAASSKEDLYTKIVELFKSFKNEMLYIDRKRHLLPAFTDVSTRVVGEAGPYIIAHGKGRNWICQIRERCVQEKHVQDFVKDSESGKYKFHRRVFIVLDSIDDNARLLAKQEDVWIWNLHALNRLLDFYGKYKIVKYYGETTQ